MNKPFKSNFRCCLDAENQTVSSVYRDKQEIGLILKIFYTEKENTCSINSSGSILLPQGPKD